MASIEIDIDVEEVRLEARHEAADGRAQTDIGDPADRSAGERIVGAVAADAPRIDPEGRVQIIVETEIRGRKADRAAAPVASRDAAVNFPEPAEQRRRLVRLAGLQQLADVGRGVHRCILAADRLDHGYPEAVLQTLGLQKIGRPAAAVAEGAIPADDDM